MPNCSEDLRSRTGRCAVCDGKFGLVRYYSWRKPLCSKKCVERFTTRSVGVTAIGWVDSRSLLTCFLRTVRGPHEDADVTTRTGISGDGAEPAPRSPNHDGYRGRDPARDAPANDYQRRAEKATSVDAARSTGAFDRQP